MRIRVESWDEDVVLIVWQNSLAMLLTTLM